MDGLVVPELELAPETIEQSSEFIGQWNTLVSTTNWEKGQIINEWRNALINDDAKATEYSDEAWAQLVGGVTSQHVGRLRRVSTRFGETFQTFEGLFWTHFLACLDWDDAEMWLEGAIQNSWSVSQMRNQRWETMGKLEPEPKDDDIIAADLDEDFEPAAKDKGDFSSSPLAEGPDFGDQDESSGSKKDQDIDGAEVFSADDDSAVQFVRPFENIAELPEDLADAFESFKLAILRHKVEGWADISREDVLASLEALKELATAPAAEDAPF